MPWGSIAMLTPVRMTAGHNRRLGMSIGSIPFPMPIPLLYFQKWYQCLNVGLHDYGKKKS